MNKHLPCVFVIPEDDADRQIADGFVLHPRVKEARIQVVPPAGGWSKVLKTFRDEYLPKLGDYPNIHVIMLIDFDGQVEKRKADFEQQIPAEFKLRVFVIGSKHTPETLKRDAKKKSFEEIGRSLADDCDAGTVALWGHEQLSHNDADRQRLVETVRPFLLSAWVKSGVGATMNHRDELIPIGTWIQMNLPGFPTFIGFTYIDQQAGPSAKGGARDDPNLAERR